MGLIEIIFWENCVNFVIFYNLIVTEYHIKKANYLRYWNKVCMHNQELTRITKNTYRLLTEMAYKQRNSKLYISDQIVDLK